ncbi:guanylate cyclase [Chloropicon primus]|nr:guanylate cyclase [Chloropicon primus]
MGSRSKEEEDSPSGGSELTTARFTRIVNESWGEESSSESEDGKGLPRASLRMLLTTSAAAAAGEEEEAKDSDSMTRVAKDFYKGLYLGAGGRGVDIIDDEVYKQHTKWCGLKFKGDGVEEAFRNNLAELCKDAVYKGYLLQLGVILFFVLQSGLMEFYRSAFCTKQVAVAPGGTGEAFCQNMFLLEEEQVEDFAFQYMSFFVIMTAVLFVFNVGGIILHWIAHRRLPREKKFAATWIVFSVYAAELAFITITILVGKKDWYLWPILLFLAYVALFTICLWFTGTLFLQNCALFVGGGVLYFALSIPIVTSFARGAGEDGWQSVRAFMQTVLYLNMAPMNFLFCFILLFGSWIDEQMCRRRFLAKVMISYQDRRIIREKERIKTLQKKLLENLLPPCILKGLMRVDNLSDLRDLSSKHYGVSIMFADVVGFTTMSSTVEPLLVMSFLNELFYTFDNVCDDFNVYKVETVGDCYVAAVGVVTGSIMTSASNVEHDQALTSASQFNTTQMIAFAKATMRSAKDVDCPSGAGARPALRVGIHTGPCMSGIVGTKNLRFCLFGDAMNTAARMEQKGLPDCIHTTQDVVDLVPGEPWERLAKMEVKGKGKMQTYLLSTRNPSLLR